MITAVDSNVLLDVLGADPTFGNASLEVLRTSLRGGRLIACEVVWAEVATFFDSGAKARAAFDDLGVEYDAMNEASAVRASEAWRSYRRRGGRRDRVIADFLIGAHALTQAERLLTRDRGFYKTYFSRLRVVDPAG